MNKELRAKNDEELLKMMVQLKGQLLQLRFLHANGELEKPHKINQVRKLLARVLTILNQRKVDLSKASYSAIITQKTTTTPIVKPLNDHQLKKIKKVDANNSLSSADEKTNNIKKNKQTTKKQLAKKIVNKKIATNSKLAKKVDKAKE